MTIKQRLIKLERAAPAIDEDIHIMITIVEPGGIKPIGYRSDEGTEIMRKLDESESDFKARCHDVVSWPIGENSRHIFEPIYSD
jgi:hypothetical protein